MKRNRLDIIHDILIVLKERGNNMKPTHILYKSNLSHKMLKLYLGELMEKELVREEAIKDGKKRYSLTPKGFDFLREFSAMKGFIESYGLEE
ncbi:MAG: winged helix-turn-helix transcriptional regulator [Candidatus Woesearchaeota archaeon]|nr:MAG: winged helix-turn-helix transcriptional regulator [Candidatus Woesearchaeota archaeon]